MSMGLPFCYGFCAWTRALPPSSCSARTRSSQATHVGPVISVMSRWGTGTDWKGHLMLCVWHMLTWVPRAPRSPSPWGGGSVPRVGEKPNRVFVVWVRHKAVYESCWQTTSQLTWMWNYFYFYCNQDFCELWLCLMWIQHHSTSPALSYAHIHFWVSTLMIIKHVSWMQWRDQNVPKLLVAAAREIHGWSFTVFVAHSLPSASDRHRLDDTAVKACHMYCVNKRGKCVFWGALPHVPQPAGPVTYGTWWNVFLPVVTQRYFSTISLAIQNLFLHASKLHAMCWDACIICFQWQNSNISDAYMKKNGARFHVC